MVDSPWRWAGAHMGSKLGSSDLYSGLSDNTSVCTNVQHMHSLCLSQHSMPGMMMLPAKITTTILHCRQIWPRLPCWQSTNSSRRVAHRTPIRQHGKILSIRCDQRKASKSADKRLGCAVNIKCHVHEQQLEAGTISHKLVVLLSNQAGTFGAAARCPA